MQFKSLQLKRGTKDKLAAYTGPAGELTVDAQDWTLSLHDGVTAGGKSQNEGSQPISAPEILSPVSGSAGVPASPTIQTSGFAGNGTHVASRIQFASDEAFTTILHDSQRTTASLTSYSLEAAGVELDFGQLVYCRAWHESDTAGVSDWSPVVSFTIQAMKPGAVINGDIVAGKLDGQWVLVADATKRVARAWGSSGTDTTLPNDPSVDPNGSVHNTDVLVGRGAGKHPAAEYCRSLGADYALGNQEVLSYIEANRAAIDAADTSGGANTLAAIAAGSGTEIGSKYAWASTEVSATEARGVRMSGGSHHGFGKGGAYWVIPVRLVAAA